MTDSESIYQLKILVRGSKPLIWRRLHTPDISLARLHHYLQAVMGWNDAFRHAYKIRGQFYVDNERHKSPVMISPSLRFSKHLSGTVRRWLASSPILHPPLDEAKTTLSGLALEEGEWFLYEYGRWWLRIIYQKPRRSRPGASYPICVKGRRASPPEQLSGMHGVRSINDTLSMNEHERKEGYRDFLAAIQNRRHPKHKAWVAWHGGEFSPEAFDLEAVNKMLTKLR